jgi:hypothetical protein
VIWVRVDMSKELCVIWVVCYGGSCFGISR